MKKEKIIDIILMVVIVVCVFMLLSECDKGQRNKESNVSWSLTKNEQKHILKELNKRNVGDCIIEPFKDGWKCTDAEGKIYIVKK